MSNLGTATGTININASGAQQGADQASDALTRLTTVVRDNWWGLRNLGLAFSGFSLAVVGSLASATKAAIDWESAMAGVQRTTFDTALTTEENAANLALLDRELRNLAQIKPLDSTSIAGLAEELGALGIAAANIPAATSVVADLVATTDLTNSSAATGLARIAGLLGVSADQYANLGSTILEAGRSTAATEGEIVSLGTRIAQTGAQFGLSADQVIGFSAAIISAGIRSEAGGTAIQKTFADISNAITTGGTELEVFAGTAGQTTEEFAAGFREDAGNSLLLFVQGLSRAQTAGQDLNAILRNLGITEARQVRTLVALAAAENQNVNENFKLSRVLEITNKAMTEGTALSEIAGNRYETTAAQIQLLKNKLEEVGRVFGELVLPFLGKVITVLGYFLDGMAALPGPLRVTIVVLGLVTAGIAALGAGLLLLGPRILLVRESLQQLAVAAGGAGGAVTAAAGATAAASASMASSAALLNASSAGLASKNAAAGIGAVGTAAASSAPLLARLAGGAGKFTKGLGYLGAALAVGSIAVSIFGANQKDAVDPAEDLTRANTELAESIRRQEAGIDNSVDLWVAEALAMTGAAGIAKELGEDLGDLQDIILGTDPDKSAAFIEKYGDATEEANPKAYALYEIVRLLNEEYEASYDVYAQAAEVKAKLGVEDAELSEAERKLATDIEAAARALEDRNRATISLVSAQFAARRAQIDLQKATDDYNESLAEQGDTVDEVAKATTGLTRAQQSYARAIKTLKKAEADLLTARQKQAEQLADSQRDYEDAVQDQLESNEKVLESEKELDELRAGPTIRDLVKATNALRKAQDRLGDSETDLADAEWYLNYLREEGASDRDIKNAEEAVQDARDEVAYATEDLAESESDLNDLRIDSPAYQEKIREAEKAVAEAKRDAEESNADLKQAEEELNQLRSDVANDTAYQEALASQEDAALGVEEALYGIRDAELALAEARANIPQETGGSVEDNYVNLEESIYRTAAANAEARKQAALARGENVDAADEAGFLADELEKLIDLAPDAASQRRLREYVRLLRTAEATGAVAPTVPTVPGAPATTGSGSLSPVNSKNVFPDDTSDASKEGDSWIDKIFKGMGGGAGVGGLIGGILGSVFPGVGTLVGGLIGTLIGTAIGWLVERFWPQISGFFTDTLPEFGRIVKGWFKAIPEKAGAAIEEAVEFVRGLPGKIGSFATTVAEKARSIGSSIAGGIRTGLETIDNIASFVTGIPGRIRGWIGDTAGSLLGKGKDLAIGLWNGVWAWITQPDGFISRIAGIPGQIPGWIGKTFEILKGKGRDLVVGLWNGFVGWVNAPDGLPSRLRGIAENIPGYLGNAWDVLFEWGENIIEGLWNGIVGKFNTIFSGGRSLWNTLVRAIPGGFADELLIESPSKVFRGFGENIMEGLAIGLVGSMKQVENAMGTVAEAMTLPDMEFEQSWLDIINDLKADPDFNRATASLLLETQQQVDIARALPPEPPRLSIPPTTQNNGDTYKIEDVQKADAGEIASEIMFTKLLRVRS